MDTLLAELRYKDVVTANDTLMLRDYILQKNPHISQEIRARIFADAVSKIVDKRLPKLADEYRKRLKELLFKDIVLKPAFSVDCSEILKAAVKLKTLGSHFFVELGEWLNSELGKPVDKENIFKLVIQVHKVMAEFPERDVADIIDTIDREIGVLDYKPERHVASSEYEISKQDKQAVDCETTFHDDMASHAPVPVSDSGDEAHFKKGFFKYFRNFLKSLAGYGFASRLSPGKTIVLAGFAGLIISSLFTFNLSSFINREKADVYSSAQVNSLNNELDMVNKNFLSLSPIEEIEVMKMKATAYDLSLESCGKLPGEPGYGITRSGTKAKAGRTVAVDPEIIPLGSKLQITFPDEYKYLNGTYYAEDTGRLIKGNKVDIFFGEDKPGSKTINRNAMKFGIQMVEIRIIK